MKLIIACALMGTHRDLRAVLLSPYSVEPSVALALLPHQHRVPVARISDVELPLDGILCRLVVPVPEPLLIDLEQHHAVALVRSRPHAERAVRSPEFLVVDQLPLAHAGYS